MFLFFVLLSSIPRIGGYIEHHDNVISDEQNISKILENSSVDPQNLKEAVYYLAQPFLNILSLIYFAFKRLVILIYHIFCAIGKIFTFVFNFFKKCVRNTLGIFTSIPYYMRYSLCIFKRIVTGQYNPGFVPEHVLNHTIPDRTPEREEPFIPDEKEEENEEIEKPNEEIEKPNEDNNKPEPEPENNGEESSMVEITDDLLKQWSEKDKFIEEVTNNALKAVKKLNKENDKSSEEIEDILNEVKKVSTSVKHSLPKRQPVEFKNVADISVQSISGTGRTVQQKGFFFQFLSALSSTARNMGLRPRKDGLYHMDSKQGNATIHIADGISRGVAGIKFQQPDKKCAIKKFYLAFIQDTELVAVSKRYTLAKSGIDKCVFTYPVKCDYVKIIAVSNWGDKKDVCFNEPEFYTE